MNTKPTKRSQAAASQRPYTPVRDKDWHWTYTVMLVGLFGVLITLVYVGHQTVVSKVFLLRVQVIASLAGLLIPYPLYMRWFKLYKTEALLFNILVVGPVFCMLFLWLNLIFSSPAYEETYAITDIEVVTTDFPREQMVLYTLQDSAYADFEEMRRFDLLEREQMTARGIRYTIVDGLFGFKVCREHELLLE